MKEVIPTFEQKYQMFVQMEREAGADDFTMQLVADWRELHGRHPFFPIARPVDVLNLIMRREHAERILSGEKRIEWRNYSMSYYSRLIDDKTAEYLSAHRDDGLLMELCPTAIRPVSSIHFHNYNNSWTMDCEVLENNVLTIDKTGIGIMHDVYGNHDCDEEYEELSRMGCKHYPTYFFFVLGNVTGRKNI
jgi:hypothetical protein